MPKQPKCERAPHTILAFVKYQIIDPNLSKEAVTRCHALRLDTERLSSRRVILPWSKNLTLCLNFFYPRLYPATHLAHIRYSERGRALEVVLRAQQQQKEMAKPKRAPPQPPGSASANPPPYSSNSQGATHATARTSVHPGAASPGPAASVGRQVSPGTSGGPSTSAGIFQATSSASMDGNDAKALDPHFLSLPAGGNKMVRAVLQVDTDEGKFVGEARVRMAALQRFLSMRTDTSADHVDRDSTSSPRGERATNQSGGDDSAARASSDRGRSGAAAAAAGGGGGGGDRDDDDDAGVSSNSRGHETSGQGASLPRPSDASRPSSSSGHGAEGPLANDDGTIRGAQASYLQEAPRGFDSGVAFRDKNWNELVRRPDAKIGPPQVALDEKVSLSEQTSQRKVCARTCALLQYYKMHTHE